MNQVSNLIKNAQPLNAWPDSSIEELGGLLNNSAWSLVEFWAPDVIFGRLMLPHRDFFSSQRIFHLQLILCKLNEWSLSTAEMCKPYGIKTLPTIALFNANKMIKKWEGVTETDVIKHDIDAVMCIAS